MFVQPRSSVSLCCVGLVLSPRYGGIALVDGFGFHADPALVANGRDHPPRSFFRTLTFRDCADHGARLQAVERLARRIVRRHRPALVVIGSHPRECAFATAMRAAALRVLSGHRVRTIVRQLPEMHAVVHGARVMDTRDLARALVSSVCPSVSIPSGRVAAQNAYVRPAWNALGLAVTGLAEVCPMSAIALLPRRISATPLADYIHRLAQSYAHRRYATHPSHPVPRA